MSSDSSGREVIIETSAKLFNQQGYTGVSIRDIAQACGVTNAALYYHFKNKDESVSGGNRAIAHDHDGLVE